MLRFRSLGIFAITIAVLGAANMYAQKLDVSASGAKKVTLSDNVGDNQFVWVSDAPGEKIQGTAEDVSGSLSIDPADLSRLSGTITAQVASMKSGNSTRDQHLRSSTWLDAEKYPTISFAIASVRNVTVNGNKATGQVTGNFTMHGVTKVLTIPFNLTWLDESEKTRARAPGDLVMIEATFEVSLADFKVKGREGVIGSNVGESISVKAKLFGSTK